MATVEVAATLDLTPVPVNICITRGDDRPFSFRFFESDGTTARDLSGFTAFRLTVSSVRIPVGGTPAPEFALLGSATAEVVTFTPTAGQMDLDPKKYYFDIQFEDPIFTEVKGEFLVSQDIDKT